MKLYLKYLYHILSFVGLCFSIYIGYDLIFINKNPTLQVTKIYSKKLPNDNYETYFRIQNIGAKTILNIPSNKDLIGKILKIELNNIKNFSGMFLTGNFPVEDTSNRENVIEIEFKQWMVNDYIDIIYKYKPIEENHSMGIYIDKYQLVNGEINYSLEIDDDIPIFSINKNNNGELEVKYSKWME